MCGEGGEGTGYATQSRLCVAMPGVGGGRCVPVSSPALPCFEDLRLGAAIQYVVWHRAAGSVSVLLLSECATSGARAPCEGSGNAPVAHLVDHPVEQPVVPGHPAEQPQRPVLCAVCCAVLCCAVVWCALCAVPWCVLCAVLCCAVPCCAVLCRAVLCCVLCAVPCCAVLCCAVPWCALCGVLCALCRAVPCRARTAPRGPATS